MSKESTKTYNLLITSFLEKEHVERIREVDERINVIYHPNLIPPPRYIADHDGDPNFKRTPAQEQQWQRLLSQADILFDFDHTHRSDLPDLAPNVQWIQFTSSGIGAFVNRERYHERMPNTIFTTASGVHAQPLAEFCLLVMLMFTKKLRRVLEFQSKKVWERYTGTDLKDSTLTVVGVGRVGSKIAEFGKAVGMRVLGVDKEIENKEPDQFYVDELYHISDLMTALRQTDYLVLMAPHTPETENMIGKAELAALPQGAVLINVGRGALVVEDELIAALQSGHLAGAGLDVFATEPLPPESPLWEMPNVLVSPHSGSTSYKENALITDILCYNITRFLNGQPLRNVLDPIKMY